MPPSWPSLTVHYGGLPVSGERVETFPLVDRGSITLAWDGGSHYDAVLSRASLPPDHLLHPYLTFPAAMINRWRGLDSLHAGGVVLNGKAWAICGQATAGKSSTLAWLMTEGYSVITDDLFVVKDDEVFTGPRCLDLREETASHLGVGTDVGVVGSRRRWRVHLADAESSYPLGGLVHLAWGDAVVVTSLSPAERVRRIFEHDALQVGPCNPSSFLDLAALPTFELSRPAGLPHLASAGRRLVEVLSG